MAHQSNGEREKEGMKNISFVFVLDSMEAREQKLCMSMESPQLRMELIFCVSYMVMGEGISGRVFRAISGLHGMVRF